jgi:hypothetical protein
MTGSKPFGSWPYVDIVLLSDYRQTKDGSDAPEYCLRVHMDIPIQAKDRDTIDGYLKKNDNAAVLKRVLQIAPAEPDSPAVLTLKAALGG